MTKAILIAGLFLIPVSATAEEKETYTYDVYGRLVKVEREGPARPDVVTDYEYDDANNRTRKKVGPPP